jgi:hypothetical protein
MLLRKKITQRFLNGKILIYGNREILLRLLNTNCKNNAYLNF